MRKSIHASYSSVLSDCQQPHIFFPTRTETMQESGLYFSAEQATYIFSPNKCLQPYSVSTLLNLGLLKFNWQLFIQHFNYWNP